MGWDRNWRKFLFVISRVSKSKSWFVCHRYSTAHPQFKSNFSSEKFPSKRSRPIYETAEVKRVSNTRHMWLCCIFCFLLKRLFASGNVSGANLKRLKDHICQVWHGYVRSKIFVLFSVFTQEKRTLWASYLNVVSPSSAKPRSNPFSIFSWTVLSKHHWLWTVLWKHNIEYTRKAFIFLK